ncbi:hypothetical protein Q5762_07495 [Streptomyces sp. P9(2023)]|uniref:hypothetical protein n=1 Tax=Streptomyces sp. P9(2023) TaxID=3064394 RepID=UPI0028F447DE|nr:hypothetical protein [Streptomyces sp. P9(2023)]MDT9688201.1 hypothetical protein [Streptomyces sp. P9(2023)]
MVYTPFLAGETVTAGKLNTRLVEEVMEWTPFASIGSFATNFTASGSDAPRMRKVRIMGEERWEYEGRIQVAALAVNTDTLAFTFNTGYRPAFEKGWPLVGAASAFYSVRCTLQTSGQLRVGVPTAAGASTNAILLNGMYIDNPV